jgi:3-oxoacyl-[acyl-carrier protein] reductase
MSVDYELNSRVAIITGASSGMGLASAKELAQQGVNLILVSRSKEKLTQAKKEILALTDVEIEVLSGNVIEKNLPLKAVELAIKKWGKIDILINNAGGPPMGSFLEHDNEVWDEALEQNLKSVIRFTKVVVPIMIENKWGRIINITSTLAKEPTATMVLSATARAGVSAFSKSISSELAEYGITINTLCPGGVLTDRLHGLLSAAAEKQNTSYEDVLKVSQSSIPIGRFADPKEFADMLVFIASERARYITGTTIMIDGGLSKGIF